MLAYIPAPWILWVLKMQGMQSNLSGSHLWNHGVHYLRPSNRAATRSLGEYRFKSWSKSLAPSDILSFNSKRDRKRCCRGGFRGFRHRCWRGSPRAETFAPLLRGPNELQPNLAEQGHGLKVYKQIHRLSLSEGALPVLPVFCHFAKIMIKDSLGFACSCAYGLVACFGILDAHLICALFCVVYQSWTRLYSLETTKPPEYRNHQRMKTWLTTTVTTSVGCHVGC